MLYDIKGSTDPGVLASRDLEVTGNVIPPYWMDHLRTPSDRPYLSAALVLSEVIYWNRPVYDREEKKWFKKFKGESWQANYSQIAEHWGLSHQQVRRAFYYLRDQGLITITYGSVRLDNGDVLTNVPYVALVVDKIKAMATIKPGKFSPTSIKPGKFSPGSTSKSLVNFHQHTEITSTEITKDKRSPEPVAQAGSNAPKKPSKHNNGSNGSNEPQKGESPHQELMRRYQDALGYPIANGAQEGVGAKKILKNYSPDDAIGCYHYLKSRSFWAGKHLSLMSVAKQMGPWVKSGRPKVDNNEPGVKKVADFKNEDINAVNARAMEKIKAMAEHNGYDLGAL